VQTKAVAHPTDSHLMLRAIEWLNRAAGAHGVRLRQSYLRVARRARKEAARLMHGRGHKQAKAHLRFMRTRLGRLIRDIERKITGDPVRMKAFENVLERARTIHGQKPGDTRKLYAFHAPEVECIGKGKARTRYEFGVKASLATTNERCKGGQFVLGAMSLPGNPYDGHTLGDQLDQVARVTGRKPARAYVDRGYRGHGVDREGLEVLVSHTRGIASPTIRRELRRRNGIEPVIGHMKQDGHLERNALKGAKGDVINVLLCAIGHNLRLLLAWFSKLLLLILAALLFRSSPGHMRVA
jgi:IS5 family transposase